MIENNSDEIDFHVLNRDPEGVDLRIPEVEQYAHEYDRWLDFFAMLAKLTKCITVLNPPFCWTPFILYLGHEIARPSHYFPNEDTMDWLTFYRRHPDKRRAVEIASSCRPELVHALYLSDTLWPCPLREHENKRTFVVTNNGSLYRPELLQYQDHVRKHVPTSDKCVLVPCSVYKPYPSPLHRKVMERCGTDWEIITASGTIGLAPQALWDVMPEYDSGFPYAHRVIDSVSWYFTKNKYRKIVVYSDFYAHWIKLGLDLIERRSEMDVHYCFGSHYRTEYSNLMHESSLRSLEMACHNLRDRGEP